MAVPSPATWPAATFVDDADLNLEVRDALNFLLSPPRASVSLATDPSTTDSVWKRLDFNVEAYDPYTPAAHSNSTNPSRLIAAEAGLYYVNMGIRWNLAAGGYRFYELRQNAAGSQTGGTLITTAIDPPTLGGSTTIVRSIDVQLNATDYLELFVKQTSGGALTLVSGPDGTIFQFRWVSKL